MSWPYGAIKKDRAEGDARASKSPYGDGEAKRRRTRVAFRAAILALLAAPLSLLTGCTPPPNCSVTLTSGGGNASAFIAGLAPGQTGCLVGGGYFIGSVQLRNPGVTVTAAAMPGDPTRRQRVVLVGGLQPRADNITLDNFELTGPTSFQANIEIGQTNNLTISHLDIHNDGQAKQGIITDLDSHSTNLHIVDNKIHDNGATSLEHGFYCSGPVTFGTIRGNWWWNNSGFNAMQLNGNCLGFDYVYNIADHSKTNRGIALDSGAGGINIHNSVLNGMGVTFYCSSVGGGNRVHDILASPFGPNCDSAVSFTNIHVEAPSFANAFARDYRIPNTGSQANNLARYLLGAYADRVPGPQL